MKTSIKNSWCAIVLIAITIAAMSLSGMARADSLYANDGTYLGETNAGRYDENSINNPYGKYGSRYSPDSVNNRYGEYGSRYSQTSPNNRYAQPPTVYPSYSDGWRSYQQ